MSEPHHVRLPMQSTPCCGSRVDSHTDVVGDAAPQPGDLSVCLYCASILRFGDGLGLVVVDEPERSELLAESEELTRAVGLVLTSIAVNPDHPSPRT